MKHALTVATILVAVCFLLSVGEASRRGTAAQTGLSLTSPCPDGIEDIDHCTMPGGCGDLGDALLNAAKNRTDPIPAGARVLLQRFI